MHRRFSPSLPPSPLERKLLAVRQREYQVGLDFNATMECRIAYVVRTTSLPVAGRPLHTHASLESAQAKKLAHDAKRRRLSPPPPPPPGRQLVPVTRETPLDRNESLTVVRETYHRRACVLFPGARKSVVFGVRVWNFRLEEMWYYTVDGQRDRPERVLLTEWLRSVSLNLDGSWMKGVSVSWDHCNDSFCYFIILILLFHSRMENFVIKSIRDSCDNILYNFTCM